MIVAVGVGVAAGAVVLMTHPFVPVISTALGVLSLADAASSAARVTNAALK
jgi:hypothetical protein